MNVPLHRSQINIDTPKVVLEDSTAEKDVRVTLKSTSEETAIKDADRLLLKGEGYGSPKEAEEGAAAWRSRLIAALASVGLGVDLGNTRSWFGHY